PEGLSMLFPRRLWPASAFANTRWSSRGGGPWCSSTPSAPMVPGRTISKSPRGCRSPKTATASTRSCPIQTTRKTAKPGPVSIATSAARTPETSRLKDRLAGLLPVGQEGFQPFVGQGVLEQLPGHLGRHGADMSAQLGRHHLVLRVADRGNQNFRREVVVGVDLDDLGD